MNPGIAKQVGINLDVVMPSFGQFDNRKAPLMTRDGQIIRGWDVQFGEPIFKNSYVPGTRNSIEFQNAGTSKAIINGNWTLLPGGSKKFDSSDEVNINSRRFVIYFPSDPWNDDGLNRVETSEIFLCDLTVSQAKFRGLENG